MVPGDALADFICRLSISIARTGITAAVLRKSSAEV
jgi:hypothetical protein